MPTAVVEVLSSRAAGFGVSWFSAFHPNQPAARGDVAAGEGATRGTTLERDGSLPSKSRPAPAPTRYLATVSEAATITARFWAECVALAVSVPLAVTA